MKTEAKSKPTRKKEDSPARARFEWALLIAFIPLHLFGLQHHIWSDGVYRARDLQALIEHGNLTSFRFSFVGPLFSAPLYLLDRAIGQIWFLPRYNVFVFGAGLWLFSHALRDKISDALLRRFLLVLAVGSMFPYALTTYYGETFSAVTIATGLAFLVAGQPLLGWILQILGVVNMPTLMVGFGLVALYFTLREKRLRPLLAVVCAFALVLFENFLHRDDFLDFGYKDGGGVATPGIMPYDGLAGFTFPFVLGVVAILFSFGRGLAFFAPGLWLGLSQRTHKDGLNKQLSGLWLLVVVGLLLVDARWWMWHGAVFWGPRFFLLASVPAAFWIAILLQDGEASAWQTLAALVAWVASIWVGINGAIFNIKGLYPGPDCVPAEGQLCLYAPEFSPLWRPFREWTPPTDGEWWFMIYALLVMVVLGAAPVQRLAKQAVQRAQLFWHEQIRAPRWRF